MNLRENISRSKEVLGAYFRQGLHELGSALYGPGTAAQHPEYGMLGTKPPSMVVEGLKGEHDAVPSRNDAAPSQLETHLEQAKGRGEPLREPERDERPMDRE
ncbi:MAG: hypothetical protein KF684_01880 [Phycisphaeraceae bacterium]|nr:hypothetical protein [Phycisphaeraceae bacterium]